MKIRLRWLFPGLKLKRWVLLCLVGGCVAVYSLSQFFLRNTLWPLWVFFFSMGIVSLIIGIVLFIRSLLDAVVPSRRNEILDVLYKTRYLEKGPRVVVFGGGTGLSNLLSGLKEFTYNITAVVTVADEGGSSGRLRKEFDILPPGDIRNCLVALASASELMRRLFQYRFVKGEGFEGHSFGNLFITAMTEVTGSFDIAIKESSKILSIRGQVLPVTLEKIRIKAEYIDGSTQEGEDIIPQKGIPIKRILLSPENIKANTEVLEALQMADLVLFGPGSLYTSILPSLLVPEIPTVLKRLSVPRLYVCNVMTQYGETDGFTASMHLKVLLDHVGSHIVDACLLNAAASDAHRLLRYAEEKSFPVLPDADIVESLGCIPFEANLISSENFIRHDPIKLARKIIEIYTTWNKHAKTRARSYDKK